MTTTHKRVMNTITHTVILRKEALNKQGLAPLSLQLFINSVRVVVPLYIYIPVINWDKDKRAIVFVKESSLSRKEIQQYNEIIEKAHHKVLQIRHQYDLQDIWISKELFLEEFTTENRKNDFFSFAHAELDTLLRNNYREPSTIRSMRSSVQKLKAFHPCLRFADLTLDLIQAFDGYLRKECNLNTAQKHHKVIKTLINIALRKGIRMQNPYDDFRIKRIDGNRQVLDEGELKALEALYKSGVQNPIGQRVLQAFLFSCFSGIRLSDIRRLTWECVHQDLIHFIPHKTKNERPKMVTIHLHTHLKSFLPQMGDEPTIFTLPTDQYMNRCIKDFMLWINSPKRITFHSARHTFATQYLKAGGRLEILRKIMGHSKIDTTMIYVHHSTHDVVKEMNRLSEAFSGLSA